MLKSFSPGNEVFDISLYQKKSRVENQNNISKISFQKTLLPKIKNPIEYRKEKDSNYILQNNNNSCCSCIDFNKNNKSRNININRDIVHFNNTYKSNSIEKNNFRSKYNENFKNTHKTISLPKLKCIPKISLNNNEIKCNYLFIEFTSKTKNISYKNKTYIQINPHKIIDSLKSLEIPYDFFGQKDFKENSYYKENIESGIKYKYKRWSIDKGIGNKFEGIYDEFLLPDLNNKYNYTIKKIFITGVINRMIEKLYIKNNNYNMNNQVNESDIKNEYNKQISNLKSIFDYVNNNNNDNQNLKNCNFEVNYKYLIYNKKLQEINKYFNVKSKDIKDNFFPTCSSIKIVNFHNIIEEIDNMNEENENNKFSSEKNIKKIANLILEDSNIFNKIKFNNKLTKKFFQMIKIFNIDKFKKKNIKNINNNKRINKLDLGEDYHINAESDLSTTFKIAYIRKKNKSFPKVDKEIQKYYYTITEFNNDDKNNEQSLNKNYNRQSKIKNREKIFGQSISEKNIINKKNENFDNNELYNLNFILDDINNEIKKQEKINKELANKKLSNNKNPSNIINSKAQKFNNKDLNNLKLKFKNKNNNRSSSTQSINNEKYNIQSSRSNETIEPYTFKGGKYNKKGNLLISDKNISNNNFFKSLMSKLQQNEDKGKSKRKKKNLFNKTKEKQKGSREKLKNKNSKKKRGDKGSKEKQNQNLKIKKLKNNNKNDNELQTMNETIKKEDMKKKNKDTNEITENISQNNNINKSKENKKTKRNSNINTKRKKTKKNNSKIIKENDGNENDKNIKENIKYSEKLIIDAQKDNENNYKKKTRNSVKSSASGNYSYKLGTLSDVSLIRVRKDDNYFNQNLYEEENLIFQKTYNQLIRYEYKIKNKKRHTAKNKYNYNIYDIIKQHRNKPKIKFSAISKREIESLHKSKSIEKSNSKEFFSRILNNPKLKFTIKVNRSKKRNFTVFTTLKNFLVKKVRDDDYFYNLSMSKPYKKKYPKPKYKKRGQRLSFTPFYKNDLDEIYLEKDSKDEKLEHEINMIKKKMEEDLKKQEKEKLLQNKINSFKKYITKLKDMNEQEFKIYCIRFLDNNDNDQDQIQTGLSHRINAFRAFIRNNKNSRISYEDNFRKFIIFNPSCVFNTGKIYK